MQHINKLFLQLKREVRPSVYSAMCIIERVGGKWIANPVFWDGKLYSGYMEGILPSDWISEYNTADEAAEAVQRLFDTLDIGNDNPVIIIDDIWE